MTRTRASSVLPVMLLTTVVFCGVASGLDAAGAGWIASGVCAVLLFCMLGFFVVHPSMSVYSILISIPAGGIVLPILDKTPKCFFPSLLSLALIEGALLSRRNRSSIELDSGWIRQRRVLCKATLVYAILCVFSAVQMAEPSRSLYLVMMRFITMIAFLLVLLRGQESFQGDWVLRCVMVVGGAIASLYLVNAVFTYEASSIESLAAGLATKDNRASAGLLGTTNTIGSFLAFTLPLTMAAIGLPGISRRWKASAILLLWLQICGLLGTNSRGGVIALAGGVVLAMVLAYGQTGRVGILGKGLAVVLVAGCAAIVLTPGVILGRYANVLSQDVVLENLSRRYQLYDSSWRAFRGSPIAGIGIGNIGLFDLLYGTGAGSESHNLYLQTLAEEGIIGFFVLSLLLFILGRRLLSLCRRAEISQVWILAAFLSALLNALVEPTFWHPPFASLFWLSMAVLVNRPVRGGIESGGEGGSEERCTIVEDVSMVRMGGQDTLCGRE